MVTATDAKKWSNYVLAKKMDKAMDELDAIEAETKPIASDVDNLKKYDDRVKEAKKVYNVINNELVRRESEDKVPPVPPVTQSTNNNSLLNIKVKSIDKGVAELEKFGPGKECFTFIRNVKNLSRLAECDVTRDYMIKALFNRLCPEYQTMFNTHHASSPVKTIEEFTEWIGSTFESKKSIFQYLQELDNMQLMEGEAIRDYAGRIEEQVFDVQTIIAAKFKEGKKKSKPDFDGELETENVFAFMAGTILLRGLQSDREAYNYTITRVDECFDARDIANVAAAYKERSQYNDPILSTTMIHHTVPIQTHEPRPPIDIVCRWYKKNGKCTKEGKGCRFKHSGPHNGDNKQVDQNGQKGRRGRNKGNNGVQKGNDAAANGQADYSGTSAPQSNHARITGAQVFQ